MPRLGNLSQVTCLEQQELQRQREVTKGTSRNRVIPSSQQRPSIGFPIGFLSGVMCSRVRISPRFPPADVLFRTVIADSNIHERLSHEHEHGRCDEELSARSNARFFDRAYRSNASTFREFPKHGSSPCC